MTAIQRPVQQQRRSRHHQQEGGRGRSKTTMLATIFVFLFVGIVYLALLSPEAGETTTSTGNSSSGSSTTNNNKVGSRLRISVAAKQQQLREALAASWLGQEKVSSSLPLRLRELRNKHEIVGERLALNSTPRESDDALSQRRQGLTTWLRKQEQPETHEN